MYGCSTEWSIPNEGGRGKDKQEERQNLFNHLRHLRHREKQNLLSCGFLLKVLFFKGFLCALSVFPWLMVFLISSQDFHCPVKIFEKQRKSCLCNGWSGASRMERMKMERGLEE
jgi:hypothetical protein